MLDNVTIRSVIVWATSSGEGTLRDSEQAWVEDFLDRLLALWRQQADTANGLFDPYLDRQWRHHVDGPRTLVSQCRLIYTFSRAYERSADERYADLAHRGIAALIQYFHGPNAECWLWACHGNGNVEDDTSNAYGHAFVILALATAARIFRDDRYRDLALRTWAFMQRRFRDAQGGLIWNISRDGQILEDVRSQNPLMHTFEALLVLAPLDESDATRRDAAQIWDFVKSRMPEPGLLPEWFDAEWQPVNTGERAVVEVGHLFEWAFLLSEAQALFPEDDLLTPARQFLAAGMRHGYDAAAGGIFSQIDYEGRVIVKRKGWWEQCEAIRAMQRHVARHEANEIVEPLRQSIGFVRQRFVDDEYGGWYLNPPAAAGEPSLVKGNAWKLDYHVVNMCLELLAE
jgi:mannose/cellobiose epimerase-like protein (N-acyl-D-glucosamine 2-epimerase family)